MSNASHLQDILLNATDTHRVVIGAGALASVAEVFKQSFDNRSAVIIADKNAFDVAGRKVQRQFLAAHFNPIEPFILPGRPQLYADYEHVLELDAALETGCLIECVENLFAPGGFWFAA